MKPEFRQNITAAGFFTIFVIAIGGAITFALSLQEGRGRVAGLQAEVEALSTRASKLPPASRTEAPASLCFVAPTITRAGALLQARVEAAIAQADGRLRSSKVDVGFQKDARRIELEADLTIAQLEMQRLLFDLETGLPLLFVDRLEARAPDASGDGTDLNVTIKLSARWACK